MPEEIVLEEAYLDDFLAFARGSCLAETALLDDEVVTGRYNEITETVFADDALVLGILETITEAGFLGDVLVPVGQPVEIVLEEATIRGYIARVQTEVLSDAGFLDDELHVTRSYVITEAGFLDDGHEILQKHLVIITETAALGDALDLNQQEIVTESIGVGDEVHITRELTLEEDGYLGDELLGLGSPVEIVTESASLGDDLAILVAALEIITESIGISAKAVTTEPGVAWTAPTDTFGMSTFDNYPYEGIASVNGKTVLQGSDGLYIQSGTKDNGANFIARMKIDTRRLANHLARFGYVYATYSSDGNIAAEVTDHEAGTGRSNTYPFESRTATSFGSGRAKAGRGLKSGAYSVAIKNLTGSSFSIHDLKLVFDETSRKV